MRLYVLIIMLALSSASHAALINFDDITMPEFVFTNDGDSIDSSGFSFSAGSAEGQSGFIEAGSSRDLGGLFNANGANIAMRASDNSTFDLGSFDIARRENDTTYGRSASDVVVIGNLLAGGTVEFRTGALEIAFGEIILPSTFKNLTSVIFNPERFPNAALFDFEFVLDNINTTNLSQVSAPASISLLFCALAIMGLRSKRRKA